MMRKVVLTILFVFGMFFSPQVARADQLISLPNNETGCHIYADKATAVANGSDTIRLQMKFTYHIGGKMPDKNFINGTTLSSYGSPPESNYAIMTVSGSGNTITTTQAKAYFLREETSGQYNDYGSEIYDYIYIKSTVAERKNLTFKLGVWQYDYGNTNTWKLVEGDACQGTSSYVTFTPRPTSTPSAPVSNTNTGNHSITPTPTPTPTPTRTPTPTPEKIITTKILGIKFGNKEYEGDKDLTQTIKQGEKIVFRGKTYPSKKVILIFHSNPFEAETYSDKNGDWSYELTRDLGIGAHSLELTIIDTSQNNKFVEKTDSIKFSIVAKETNVVQTANKPFYKSPIVLGSFAVILLGLAIGGVFVFKKTNLNKNKKAKVSEDTKKES